MFFKFGKLEILPNVITDHIQEIIDNMDIPIIRWLTGHFLSVLNIVRADIFIRFYNTRFRYDHIRSDPLVYHRCLQPSSYVFSLLLFSRETK